MITGYIDNQPVWQVSRVQRNPGRFRELHIPTGKTDDYYVDICGYTKHRTLLKGIRSCAKNEGMKLCKN